jgi:splicing suppressor protein 51
MADANVKPDCANCAKTQADPNITLKRCAKCQTTYYCSRECQKADWKVHKRVCASNAAAATASHTTDANSSSSSAGATAASKGLSVTISKPFHRLDDRTWLHDRPEEDVYRLLIDTYRLRMEDNFKLEGRAETDSIYHGNVPDGRKGFQRFLYLAQSHPGLLPSWWSQEKVTGCVAVGMKKGEWSDLARRIEKDDLSEHYGNPLMPMQLRMFGEQVYGRGPGGHDGTSMRKMQMRIENGEMGSFSHFSIS